MPRRRKKRIDDDFTFVMLIVGLLFFMLLYSQWIGSVTLFFWTCIISALVCLHFSLESFVDASKKSGGALEFFIGMVVFALSITMFYIGLTYRGFLP
ncbi:MAG: hypothetical protein ACE5K4_02850 [Candidatus Hydrothermarchaeota archaeon]